MNDCKKHDFEEVFNASENSHKPIKVCGKCHKGYDVKHGRWYTPQELYQIKSKLKHMKEERPWK